MQVPPLVVSQEASQDRIQLPPVDSELFHQVALNRRLERLTGSQTSQSSDSLQQNTDSSIFEQTINQSSIHKKFDLNQFLQNAVYPAECNPDSSQELNSTILNASHLVNHLRSTKQPSSNEYLASSQSSSDIQSDLDDTIVNEDLVLSLTQRVLNTTLMNETLNENEHDVLDILEVLEDDEQQRDEETCIDADSTLAPLSQAHEAFKFNHSQRFVTTTQLNQSTLKETHNLITSFTEEDSDDDLLNEFSMSILECLPSDDGAQNR